jgi:hypothetical protein|tara:strand:+ start:417 stop:926 length:510 start_codon:yes stop_codon:yes gene_type:complete
MIMTAQKSNTAQRFEDAYLKPAERKPLPDTHSYEIDKHGFVYRKGKRIALQRKGEKWFAQVYTTTGKRLSFDSERLARVMFGEEEYILNQEDIEKNFNVRPVPDFPRYVVTPYGAIYCIDPPKRGKNAGRCYLLNATMKPKSSYVTLYLHDGRKRMKRVKDVIASAWGD